MFEEPSWAARTCNATRISRRLLLVLLPNHAEATIAVEKLRDFLLDAEHSYGQDRARIFLGLGFRRENWQELEIAIRLQIATNEAIDSPGYPEPRFVVMGDIHGPAGSRHFWTI
jgi:hypothetical protein